MSQYLLQAGHFLSKTISILVSLIIYSQSYTAFLLERPEYGSVSYHRNLNFTEGGVQSTSEFFFSLTRVVKNAECIQHHHKPPGHYGSFQGLYYQGGTKEDAALDEL